MVSNPKEIDIRGKKIRTGDKIRLYQYKQSVFMIESSFENQEDADKMAQLHAIVTKKKMKYKKYGDEYMLCYANDIPYAYEVQEIISEKTVFKIKSEHDIPEISIKKGDEVMVLGGEGYAAGICRYEPYMLEVL